METLIKTTKYEQMYWVSGRGVFVTLPKESTAEMARSCGGKISPLQAERLAIIDNNSILKQRYPNSIDGTDYMRRVDYCWRDQLLEEASTISEVIKDAVVEVADFTYEQFAIVLFGSVARGLSKSRRDSDPSNIDLSVIGDFSFQNREDILNTIRPDRDRGSKRIGNNIGVFVQTPDKLTKNEYCVALQFIGACAQPLHDTGGIWHELEEKAIQFSLLQREKNASKHSPANRVIRNYTRETNPTPVELISPYKQGLLDLTPTWNTSCLARI